MQQHNCTIDIMFFFLDDSIFTSEINLIKVVTAYYCRDSVLEFLVVNFYVSKSLRILAMSKNNLYLMAIFAAEAMP